VNWKLAIRHRLMMSSEEMGSMSYEQGATSGRITQNKLESEEKAEK